METIDDVGFIGRNPADQDNVFIVTGDSGMGMTCSLSRIDLPNG